MDEVPIGKRTGCTPQTLVKRGPAWARQSKIRACTSRRTLETCRPLQPPSSLKTAKRKSCVNEPRKPHPSCGGCVVISAGVRHSGKKKIDSHIVVSLTVPGAAPTADPALAPLKIVRDFREAVVTQEGRGYTSLNKSSVECIAFNERPTNARRLGPAWPAELDASGNVGILPVCCFLVLCADGLQRWEMVVLHAYR